MSEGRHVSTPKPAGVTMANGGPDGGIDVAIEEDAIEVEKKPVAAKAPEPAPSSQRSLDGAITKRTRAKVTLKIPDDEVSRPQLTPSAPPPRPGPPVSSIPAPIPAEAPLVPMTPMRIISIESPPVVKSSVPPPSQARPPLPPTRAPPPPPPPAPPRQVSSPDDSWTPYESAVADRVPPAHPPPVAPLAPRRLSAEATGPLPVVTAPAAQAAVQAPVIPPAPPTAPIPPEPPTEPREGSMEEILVLADEPPPSGEIEIEDDARPAEPGKALASEPKQVVATKAPAPPPPPVSPAPPRAEASGPNPVVAAAPASPPAVPTANEPAVAQPAVAPVTPPAGPIAPTPPRVVPVPDPSEPKVTVKDLPPMRALAPTEPEGLEISFEDEDDEEEEEEDDDDKAPVSTPRMSEPEAEIGAEDLVSVESAPSPAKLVATKPLTEVPTPGRAFIPPGVPGPAQTPPVTASRPVASTTRSLPPPPSAAAKAASTSKVARVIVPTASPLAPPPMSESAPGRRKARPWWEELFNDDFIRTMAKISDEQIAKEVDFVEESLAVAKGAMLLDLGCGTGRHAIELTRRGYKVVGFDLSLPMLAKAAEEAQERNQKLNFVQGDMREMTFEDTFDGIYCWNTSFGFFEEEKNAQVIQRVHKALKKGGQFMLEVGNRDYIIQQAPSLAWFEGDGCICMDEMSIDWITSRMKVKRTMMMDDGRTKEIDYSIRIYSLHELGRVLHESGFRVAEVSGRTGTPGVYFGNESPKTMILAEKK